MYLSTAAQAIEQAKAEQAQRELAAARDQEVAESLEDEDTAAETAREIAGGYR